MRLRTSAVAAILFWAGGALAHAQEPGTPGNPKRAPNLTCTFIAKQCLKGCVKEAPQDFCGGYCNRTKLDCIQTGEWTGIRRRYTGVRKR